MRSLSGAVFEVGTIGFSDEEGLGERFGVVELDSELLGWVLLISGMVVFVFAVLELDSEHLGWVPLISGRVVFVFAVVELDSEGLGWVLLVSGGVVFIFAVVQWIDPTQSSHLV